VPDAKRLHSDGDQQWPEVRSEAEWTDEPWPDEPTPRAAQLGSTFAGNDGPAGGLQSSLARTSPVGPLDGATRPRASGRLSRAERRALDDERALLSEQRMDLERRSRDLVMDAAELRKEADRLERDRVLLAREREQLRAERVTLAELARQIGQ
jgi:hypothetical protein